MLVMWATFSLLCVKRANLLDDWLRRERFVYVGWSGLLLLPTAYLSPSGLVHREHLRHLPVTHSLASSFLEGCNVLTAAVSTPQQRIRALAPSPVGSRGRRQLSNRWLNLGGLWTFMALHGSLA